jgi:hypothetical protein
VQPHADDSRHRLVQRLPEQDGLGLDAADAIAEDAEAVDHRRVRVRANQRVGKRDAARDRRLTVARNSRLTWWTMPVPGGTTRRVTERCLGPAQELVAFAVALVLALDVEGERPVVAEHVDLHRVVDHEVRRHERVDQGRIAAEVGHRVAHHGQVDDRRDTGEVLEDDPRRHERDLGLGRGAGPPRGQRLDVLGPHDPSAGVAQQVLEQDLEGDRRAGDIESVGGRVHPVIRVAVVPDVERRASTEGGRSGVAGMPSKHASCHQPRGARASRRRTGAPVPGRDRTRV